MHLAFKSLDIFGLLKCRSNLYYALPVWTDVYDPISCSLLMRKKAAPP